MLTWHSIHFQYGREPVIDGVDFSASTQTTTAIIGPSGCGKSTLLKLALGLVWPQEGYVAVGGERLTATNVLHVRQQVGYVIQSGGLFPHLSARSNVGLAAKYLKRENQWIDHRIEELAALVQLDSVLLDRSVDDLSGGQRQRVGLMRALMLDPPLLLLDEPLGALDPIVRYELQEQLHALFARLKKTVVLVTHDLAEASFFTDRIVLLRDGRIEQQGSFDELLNQPANDYVATFVRAQRRVHV